jgi:hypothetical protein
MRALASDLFCFYGQQDGLTSIEKHVYTLLTMVARETEKSRRAEGRDAGDSCQLEMSRSLVSCSIIFPTKACRETPFEPNIHSVEPTVHSPSVTKPVKCWNGIESVAEGHLVRKRMEIVFEQTDSSFLSERSSCFGDALVHSKEIRKGRKLCLGRTNIMNLEIEPHR